MILNAQCLAIAICSGVGTEHTVGVWKRFLSKLIQKNVFLMYPLYPRSKKKYVTYSYMHTKDWSLLLEHKCILWHLFVSFSTFWKLTAPDSTILIFDRFTWTWSGTYQPDLLWCSLYRTEVCMGSCWIHHWPLESQSCTVYELVGSALSRGAGSSRGDEVRYQHCHRTVSTFPVQAGTSYRSHCKRYLHGHPSPVDHSIQGWARFRSHLRWRCVAQKEQLQKRGRAWMRWRKLVWNGKEFNLHGQ